MPANEWLRLILTYLLNPSVLLMSGGDLAWWQAWVFSLLIVSAGAGSRVWAEHRHPGLLAERERAGSADATDVKPWDRLLAPLMAVSLSFPLVIVAGLDHRNEWSALFPTWLNFVGLLLTAAGYAFAAWAMVENR
jgi:hypothetical protein